MPSFWAQPKSVVPRDGSAKRFRTSGGRAVFLLAEPFEAKPWWAYHYIAFDTDEQKTDLDPMTQV